MITLLELPVDPSPWLNNPYGWVVLIVFLFLGAILGLFKMHLNAMKQRDDYQDKRDAAIIAGLHSIDESTRELTKASQDQSGAIKVLSASEQNENSLLAWVKQLLEKNRE